MSVGDEFGAQSSWLDRLVARKNRIVFLEQRLESLQRENEGLKATIDKLKAERDSHLRLRKMNAKLEPSGGGGGVGITEGKPKSW